VRREAAFYFVMLGLAAAGIAAVLHWGAQLPGPPLSEGMIQAKVAEARVDSSVWKSVADLLGRNFHHPLSHLFVQLLVVIAAAQGMGRLFRAFGQPSVVGEMAAGILLGPSLLGMIAPEAFSFIFPAESLGALKLLSQVGVCLFMFTVGMELDAGHLRHKARTAVIVSHASIVVPYLLGVLLAYFLFTSLAQPGTTFTAFALFMGISMSITAFPVLARILQERKLSRTYLGSTAIACAAVDDVTAWSLLAFVVAIVRAGSLAACALNLALIALFVAVMMWIVRPGLPRWIGRERLEADEPAKGVLAAVMCVVVGASLCTEVIGIHALFGAFLAGAMMPETGNFRHKLAVRVENFSSVLLLPLFFAFTGLRTQIGLLNDVEGWLICLGIIAVATVGKLGGTAVTARITGMNWSDSLQLGALMNTRGLMELIALNIGYDLGILSPRIFTMLVLMALVTTALTGPLLSRFQKLRS
jgi:Kef-type K+ transport system membrane component KefB